VSSGVPYIGFSNETLDAQPACKAGDEIDCPHCGGKHVLEDSTPPMLLSYRCGDASYLAGVRGRSIMGVASDVSSDGSGAKQRHLLCDGCWDRRCAERGEAREPVRVPDSPAEPCCGCGKATGSGIWVLGPRGASEQQQRRAGLPGSPSSVASDSEFGACAGHEED
jgi:hypothetical protein